MINYPPGCRNMHYWPIDTDRIKPMLRQATDGPLRIAHAPNHTHFKGSIYLEAAIDRLRAQGHAIEYTKIQGVPNTEVIRLFSEADVVADQFIGGAYGYTALEAMALGKPVLTYVRSPDLAEAVDECPLINTTPDTLEIVLRWLLENRTKLPLIGAQGRVYIERWHSVPAVAERLGRMYEETGDFPQPVIDNIRKQRARQEDARTRIPAAPCWDHPWRINATPKNA
jgi:glycosyltransferase involved in cell wall biosynthesis